MDQWKAWYEGFHFYLAVLARGSRTAADASVIARAVNQASCGGHQTSIHQFHIIELADNVHLPIIIFRVAGCHLQLVGIGIVDLQPAVLD